MMKKRTLVLVLIAFVAFGASLSAEGKPITASAWADYYASAAIDGSGWAQEREIYLTFSGSPDEVTTGYFRVVDTSDTIGYDRLYMESDIAKYLKLEGVGIVLDAGYYWYGPQYYLCSNNGCWDNTYGNWSSYTSGATGPAAGVTVSLSDMVGAKFVLDGSDVEHWVAHVYSSKDWGFGTVSAEVYYDSASTAMSFKGPLSANVKYSKAFGDITPTIGFADTYLIDGGTNYIYIDAGVAYKSLVNVYGGFMAENGTNNVWGQVTVSPIALVDLKAATKFNLTTSALSVLEVEAVLNLGSADIIVGYDVNGGTNWNDAGQKTAGGPYFGVELSY